MFEPCSVCQSLIKQAEEDRARAVPPPGLVYGRVEALIDRCQNGWCQ